MTRAGQNSYLYLFTYAGTGKRAILGAYHGEELSFLSRSFPSDWERGSGDQKFGEAIRLYWTQFAKSGSPNIRGLPDWPANLAERNQCFVLGRSIGIQPIASRILALDHIMEQVVTKAAKIKESTF